MRGDERIRVPERLKVVIVAAHDSLGGAARAVYRVFESLQRYHRDDIDVTFRVIHKTIDNPSIVGGKPSRNRREYLQYWIRTRFRKYFPRTPFVTANPVLHSQALYPTGLGREINAMRPDVILLGWLGNSTLSIPEIGRLKAPIVWRLSDLWVLAGAEHLTGDARYQQGYSRASRPSHESGPDINRETFRRKMRHWRKPAHIIALSSWQMRQARASLLTKNWPVAVIPVPIDPEVWYPVDREEARRTLGLPTGRVLIVFGAGAGIKHAHKGADLLFEALPEVVKHFSKASDLSPELVLFGDDDSELPKLPVQVHRLGKLNNEQLRAVYSAADVVVVPSRQESFGQVAAEAQTCGAPVVVFDNSGLADVVQDGVTGRVVPAFDTQALAAAINWVTEDETRAKSLRENARERAIATWTPQKVADEYADFLWQASRSTTGGTRR